MQIPDLPDGVRRIALDDGRPAIIKTRRGMPGDFFAAEARGLSLLERANALRVPQVHGVCAYAIALEDLGSGQPTARDWEFAGNGLARLHRCAGQSFGLNANGYCGDSAQDNSPDLDGVRFFAERRLLTQGRRAFDGQGITWADFARVESLCARLDKLLPRASPVLIHGDLWSGNLHACKNGELALIDGAAVHYGWAECDLAMLTLFGEPPRAFFSAYESAAKISGDWRQRAPLLNLYHLFNHLNLFGSGYLGAIRTVLARFA